MNKSSAFSNYDRAFLSYEGLDKYKISDKPIYGRDQLKARTFRLDLLDHLATYAKTKIKYLHAEKSIKSIKKLKNTKSDADCLIIGNGTSKNMLSSSGLLSLKQSGWDIFGLNQYHKSPDFACHVNMYVCSDPDTLKVHPQGSVLSKKTKGLVSALEQYKPCIFHSHLYPKKITTIHGCNAYTFNDNYNPISTNISPEHARGYPSLTILKAIAIALFMGYRSIQLIGLDNFCYTRNLWFLPEGEFLFLNDSADDEPRLLLEKHMWKDTTHFLESKLKEQLGFRLFAHPNVYNLYPISAVPFIKKYKAFPEQYESLFTAEANEILKNVYNLVESILY